MQTTKENFIGKIDFDRFQRNVENAREKGHEHWIGDIPVHPELIKFFKAFKAKRYNIVPCVDANTTNYWVRGADGEMVGVGVYYKLGITYPDTPDFRSGEIHIESDPNFDGSKFTYCVKADDIENEKFASHSAGYNIRQSKDMAKALKLCSKFLSPLDYDDIEDRCRSEFRNGIEHLRSPAREKLHESLTIVRSDVQQEVAHMIASGYQPSTQAFKEVLDLIVKEGAELKRMQDYKPRACFVWLKPNSLSYRFTGEKEITECTKIEDVPELIRNKLAVLQIASNGDAITDVGIRVSAVNYWVFA